jgi:hypothetical protein
MQSLEESRAAILVIDEHAAAQSAVTRRAAIDFVHAGGGLLFVRTMQTEQLSRSTASWLSGFGIALGATEPVSNTSVNDSLSRHWRALTNQPGVPAFAVEQPRVRVLATSSQRLAGRRGHARR